MARSTIEFRFPTAEDTVQAILLLAQKKIFGDLDETERVYTIPIPSSRTVDTIIECLQKSNLNYDKILIKGI